ncbi:TrmH family RNA methyltransferase [Alicyclobacillus ferrooxydans]|nr:RNA methyltransferase [Alicyclobacillus ferrooxydans]
MLVRQVKGMYIESQKNSKVQLWAGLKTKKGRSSHGSYLAEGARLAEEALQSSRVVESVLVDVAARDDYQSLRSLAVAKGAEVYELSPQAFLSVSDTVTSQGIIAVVRQSDLSPAFPAYTLVLDGVQDPGNVGTLLRTSDAFAVSEVCCSEETADPFSPKVVRASMGGTFRLSIHRMNAASYIRTWTEAHPDGDIIITEADGEIACHEVDFSKPALIVIGSEAAGVSAAVRTLASKRVFIPMTASAESLNAAVAGSIVLYESYRQRH